MHSSRMRTARLLPVSPRWCLLPEGGDVCFPGGGVWADTPSPTCGQNSWHKLLKILPCPNFVTGGKNTKIEKFVILGIVRKELWSRSANSSVGRVSVRSHWPIATAMTLGMVGIHMPYRKDTFVLTRKRHCVHTDLLFTISSYKDRRKKFSVNEP